MDNNIEVSVVLPCFNEEKAIGCCLEKIKQVFGQEKLKGEIIVADNGSCDNSRDIAASFGANVVSEPRRGYGSAYLRGLMEAKGKYIIIGDSDSSYDFSDIPRFLQKLREGYSFVMGSRFKGTIHRRAMPLLNRYIGNPLLSCMSRIFFRTNLSDIHCGMRAFTREAYQAMKLKTLGMEFASEMVFSAMMNNLKTCEIPINYYPRSGDSKLKPFHDAWRHIRFMLLYCPLWLYFIPGMIGFAFGLSSLLVLSKGPFLFLGRLWDIHFLVFSSVFCILSYQILHLGVYAHAFSLQQGFLKSDRLTSFFQKHFNLERGLFLGAVIFLAGAGILAFIFMEWVSKHLGAMHRIRESILAMTLLVIGLQTMFSSFFISLLFLERKEVSEKSS